MASKVKSHEVDRNMYMSFIETLLIAFTVSDMLVQISQRSIFTILTLKITLIMHSTLIKFEDYITTTIQVT